MNVRLQYSDLTDAVRAFGQSSPAVSVQRRADRRQSV
jgi:hypothetical protein